MLRGECVSLSERLCCTVLAFVKVQSPGSTCSCHGVVVRDAGGLTQGCGYLGRTATEWWGVPPSEYKASCSFCPDMSTELHQCDIVLGVLCAVAPQLILWLL